MEIWKEKCKGMWKHDDKNVKGFFGDYRYLSNFHVADVEIDGIKYPSSENAYQAFKVIKEERHKFINVSPKESKEIWKELTLKYNGEIWDKKIKKHVMFSVLICKFSQNEDFKNKLISTGNKYLEETNWWKDFYWGVCYGLGDNNLGKQLMIIREILR